MLFKTIANINSSLIQVDPNESRIFHWKFVDPPLLRKDDVNSIIAHFHVTPTQKNLLSQLTTRGIKLYNRTFIIYTARDVLVNGYGTRIVNGTFYNCHRRNQGPRVTNAPVVAQFPIAICLSIQRTVDGMFGHWVHDFLACLIMIPRPVYINVPIITYRVLPSVRQMLEVIGVPKENIVNIWRPARYVYVQELYSVIGPGNSNYAFGKRLKDTVQLLQKVLPLPPLKPTVFLFKNRFQGERRYVNNFQELFNMSVQLYPQYNWKYDTERVYDIFRTSKLYHTVLCLIAPTGSNSLNLIFMQPNTIYLNLMSKWIDSCVITSTVSCDVHLVVLYDKTNSHWCRTTWNFSSSLFKDGLVCVTEIINNNTLS